MLNIPMLIEELGTKFFVGYLVGMFGGLALSRSVYVGIFSGACIGALAWLML